MTEALLDKLNEERYAVTLTPAELREIRQTLKDQRFTIAALLTVAGEPVTVPYTVFAELDETVWVNRMHSSYGYSYFLTHEPLPAVTPTSASADNNGEERVPE